MGVSPAAFESAGQRTEHFVPGSYSRSANVSSPSGVSAGNHVILASSTGGQPLKLLSFSSLSDAKDALVGGDLLKAIGYAFNCSNVYTPQKVYAMRVDPATQSEVTLMSGSTALLKCKSWDWGVHTNQLKIKVSSGTNIENSKKVEVVYKNDAIEVDDIIRESFSIIYVGDGEAPVCTITSTGISLSATVESAIGDKFSCTWEDASTLEDLCTRINDTGLYSATVLDTEADRPSKELDTISGVDITDETVFYSNGAAFVEVLKEITYIGSVEWAENTTTRTVPENNDTFVYFTGGSTTIPSVLDYSKALDSLQTEDIQIISTPSTNAQVHSLISSHCTLMSNTVNRKERTCILGAAIGTSDTDGLANARGFNSKLVSYVIDSAIVNNPLNGEKETISGAMLGVMASAMESAMSVSEPLTFKTINVLGFSKYRTNSNMEELIKGGIMVFNPNPENVSEYVCIRAVTTFQGKNDLISCERSMVREDLFMNRDLRNKFVTGIGHPNTDSTAEIVQTLKDAAAEWATNNYIVPSDKGNVWNIKVRVSGDKVYLTYSRYLTAPRNFIFITATNHVYESTVEI